MDDEELKRYPRFSRTVGERAQAVWVLLAMSETEPELSLELVWDLIGNIVSRAELRAALAAIDELVPKPIRSATPKDSRSRPTGVPRCERSGPTMMRNIDFDATADVESCCCASVSDLLATKRGGLRRGASMPVAWISTSSAPGSAWVPWERPEQTVGCRAYTLWLLEQQCGGTTTNDVSRSDGIPHSYRPPDSSRGQDVKPWWDRRFLRARLAYEIGGRLFECNSAR